jgi:hypothetical protein
MLQNRKQLHLLAIWQGAHEDLLLRVTYLDFNLCNFHVLSRMNPTDDEAGMRARTRTSPPVETVRLGFRD